MYNVMCYGSSDRVIFIVCFFKKRQVMVTRLPLYCTPTSMGKKFALVRKLQKLFCGLKLPEILNVSYLVK